MQSMARCSLLICLALLSACSSHSPTPPAFDPVPQQVLGGQADDVMFRALGLVGTPYRYGGNTPQTGFDCSGLIGFVYRDAAGIQLPRSTREMVAQRTPRVASDALQSGDLVFFATNGARQVNHAGIYVGEGRFVHAPSSGGTVRLDRLDQAYWRNSFLEARRVLQPARVASN